MEKHIDELVEKLNRASESYYNGGEEILSNYEWDEMYDELARLEAESGYVRPDSPTRNTGFISQGGNREPHEYPALSLAKTKKVAELIKWAGDREVWLSWKLDGLTLVLTYDGGRLTKIVTRGNGEEGNNITFLKGAIKGIPDTISYKGHLVVRGEAIISYPDFEEINDTLEEDGGRYANPRNLASGTLSLLDPEKVRLRRVCLYAFTLVHIDEESEHTSFGERLDFLTGQGFITVEREKTDAAGLSEAVSRWTRTVEEGRMPLPVDGLVICYEDNEYAKTGSVTGHHATRAGFAFKWQDEYAETVLDHIEWSCAVSTISPVAVFDPVSLEGTTVSRASLCNLSEIERLGLGGPGSRIRCIKANKIIPKVISVIEKKGEAEIPERCPVCAAATEEVISERSAVRTLRCTNPACPAKHLMKYTRFVSKSGMDIDGLSVQTILRFMNEGYITRFGDIYRLEAHFPEIREMEGFGEKSVANLKAAIDKSRNARAINLIFALCIPMIGLDAAKRLMSKLDFVAFLKRLKNRQSFEDIEGIGVERSASLIKWYKDEKNRLDLEDLLNEIELKEEAGSSAEGKLKGLTFVVTGDLHSYANRDALKAYVESEKGRVAGSVSGKTSFLINNDINSTSGKNKKARELNIPIITEDEFIERFG